MIEDKPLLSEYLSESEELLDSLLTDLDLLALPSPSRPDINLINRVFRTVHSLKGLTGMMGLTQMQALAHQFEDILDSVRLGKLELNEEATSLIQEAGAGLAALVGVSAKGTASEDDAAKLRDLLARISARPARSRREEPFDIKSLGLPERDRNLLSQMEIHRIAENAAAGRSFYSIQVSIEAIVMEKRYRLVTSELSDLGELIATLPRGINGRRLGGWVQPDLRYSGKGSGGEKDRRQIPRPRFQAWRFRLASRGRGDNGSRSKAEAAGEGVRGESP